MAFQGKTQNIIKHKSCKHKVLENIQEKNISPECVIKADCLNMLEDLRKTKTNSKFYELAPAVFDLALL